MSENYVNINRLLTAVFLLIIFIIVGYALFVFISVGEPTNTINDQTKNKGKSISDSQSIIWKTFPYFGKNFAFLVSYPSDWKVGDVTLTPDNPYDDQLAVSFIKPAMSPIKDTLSIKYFFDTGEDLSTWTTKRINFLTKQKGYDPIKTDITANGVEFIRLCFLGDINYSPMPDCFAYTRVTPYILELRTDSTSSSFPVQKYIEEFVSSFSLLRPDDNWSTFSNSVAGISMKYPSEKYPLISNNPGQFITFANDYIGQFMNVQIIEEWTQGPIQYWYTEVSWSMETKQLIPRKIIIGNSECYFAEFDPEYSFEGVIGAKQVFCQKQNRLYVFTISTNNESVDNDFYRMLNSVKFL